MKKMLTQLALGAAVVLTASGAMAAALGPHQQGGAANPCKECHDTARSVPALRGWTETVAPPGATSWGAKTISNLCYGCHDNTGGYIGSAHDMQQNAYVVGSHQYTIANCPEEPSGATQGTDFEAIVDTKLPYTSATNTEMECTSCHNVHVATARPFNQRATIQLMCLECHQGHENNQAAGPAGQNIPSATRAYSSHPTNVAFAESTGRANLLAAPAAVMTTLTDVAPNWNLGGHLNGATGQTGNIDCQTCHAVHGPSLGNGGLPSLLAINNSVAGSASALCEGCHFGGNAGEQVGLVVTVPAANSDHPIDARTGQPFYPTGTAPNFTAIPDGTTPTAADWTISGPNNDIGAAPFFAGLTPVCSSCHDTHGGMVNTPLLRGPSVDNANNVTWTFSYDEWCFVCHLNGAVIPTNHHSNVNNMNTAFGDEMTSQLTCNDCHGMDAGTGWSAHNGFWQFEILISPTDSAFCTSCHNVNNPRAFLATSPRGVTYAGGAAEEFPATHGVIRDGGTDVTGNAGHEMNGRNGTNTNMDLTPDWAFASGGTSEWAAGNLPICESCHNILTNGLSGEQGLTQGWKANLLLAPYEDDGAGNAGANSNAGEVYTGTVSHDFYGDTTYAAGQTGDLFCRACHNTGGTGFTGYGAGDFVHNPEAHTRYAGYTYAAGTNPYGRSTDTLLTTPNDSTVSADCPEVSTADRLNPAAAPGQASYPADNAINCDSCHRPHNADVDSVDADRYLILENVAPNAWGTTICAECHDTDVQCNN